MNLLKELLLEARGFSVYSSILDQTNQNNPTCSDSVNDFEVASLSYVEDGVFNIYIEGIYVNGLQPTFFVTNTDTQNNWGFRDFRITKNTVNDTLLCVYDADGIAVNNFSCSVLILVKKL